MKNDQYKFIFLHIPKTAGTSISHVFYEKLLGEYFVGHPSVHYDVDITAHQKNNYFKFSVQRNTFDRVVSIWSYWNYRIIRDEKKIPTVSFQDFCINFHNFSEVISNYFDPLETVHFDTCHTAIKRMTNHQLSISDIDYFINFDDLKKGFQNVCSKLNINCDLPHLNATERKHYREYYTPKCVDIISKRYKKDIEYFGHEF